MLLCVYENCLVVSNVKINGVVLLWFNMLIDCVFEG